MNTDPAIKCKDTFALLEDSDDYDGNDGKDVDETSCSIL